MTNLIERAKDFYKLALTDPVAATVEFLADDFVLENYLPEHIPFGGRYVGAEGFIQYLTEIAGGIDMGPLQMDEWCANGNTVVARGVEDSLVRSTSKKYSMVYVHWLTFNDDGQLTNMREYNDTAAMGSAFKPV